MLISTRVGTETDVANVHKLNESSLPAVNSLTANKLKTMIARSALFQVVELEQRFAGFVLTFLPNADYQSENLRWFNQYYNDFLYLDRIAIADFAKRSGCGSALYRQVENHCRENNISSIALEVNIRPRNQASLDFHQAMGYVEVGRQETGGGEKMVSLMMKNINGN